MQASTYANNQLLPPEIAASSGSWFGRARSYPIFSAAWYRYRSLALLTGSALVFVVLASFLGVPMFNAPAVHIEWLTVAKVAGVLVIPYCMLCLAGPGMAVAIRRAGLRRRAEAGAILLALLLGMLLSGALLALLVQLYETPVVDLRNDMVVAHRLPTIKFRVDAKPGARTVFLGVRNGQHTETGAPGTAPLRDAMQAMANKASAGAPARPAGTEEFPLLAPAARQAIEDMRKLDAGDPAVDPARRADIEQHYAAALTQLYRQQHRAAATIRPMAAHDQAAMASLFAAMPKQPPAPAPADSLSRDLGRFAVVLIGSAALVLACWLGGLFDLLSFLRQRGKLVDVRQKEELQRAQAARNTAELRLSVLTAQVEPHFLFNTLASVRSAITSDPQRATQIVDHMVSFLRSTIPQMRDDAGSASVTLASQLDSARSYLALMHERIARLQFRIDAEPGLEKASMPPLMLISLVENAVKHGVEPKIGAAMISVSARRLEQPEPLLEVCVSDDGVGFGETASGAGIGLANIQERLRSYYGQRASLTLKALPDGGVAAILHLPLSFEP
jgi:two-component sensor histidine kinase